MTPLAITYMDPSKLQAFKGNSRTHTEAQIAKIMAAITEFGFINPVIVAEDGTIIAGHARVQAATRLGLDSVPCILATHLNEAQRRAYVIADNRLSEDAGWDDAVLRQELHYLNNAGFDLHLTGMDDEALRKLVSIGDSGQVHDSRAAEPARRHLPTLWW
jgi:ParB-like chromosome segregation protein Spo0J